jgi:hypothetical protein
MVWVENASPQVDAQSQYLSVIIICVVLSILSITVVSTRLCIRFRAHRLGADDYIAGLSMIFALVYSILCIVRKLNHIWYLIIVTLFLTLAFGESRNQVWSRTAY